MFAFFFFILNPELCTARRNVKRRPVSLTRHGDRLPKGQMRLRRLQDEAHVCIQLAAAAGRLVTLVYLHPEPVYIHVHASAPLSSFPAYLRRRRSVRFHVTARGGVAEEGPRASLSAAVWTQLPGCDKESRKTERFHTNYGKKNEALGERQTEGQTLISGK